jgi:hypothetical protein
MANHAFARARVLRSMSSLYHLCLAVALALAASSPLAQGPAQPQAPAQLETTLKNMLAALQKNSLPDFVADGDAAFKSGMTAQMLSSFSAQFGQRLTRGYVTAFLGTLNQQGYTVYLWKLSFMDGQDDRLVTMAVKEGKVAGFVLS